MDAFVEGAVVEIEGLGLTRVCHGSPRSDEELITFATPRAEAVDGYRASGDPLAE